jgi:type IV secretion system protein VirB1
MAAGFVELAQSCAPMVQVETLASVVSLQSRFHPFAIRISKGLPLSAQPASKAEAIEVATSLIAERRDIQIGLGGLGVEELRKLGLSLSDAFDPCLNLKATGILLDGYYRLALRAGANERRAKTVMLEFYYGRDDSSVGVMDKYDEQIRRETTRRSGKLASVTVAGPDDEAMSATKPKDEAVRELPHQFPESEQAASWDVFNSTRRSSAIVFQNNPSEQSE